MKARYNLKEPGFCRVSFFLHSQLLLKWIFVCLLALSGCAANSTTIDNKKTKPAGRPTVKQQPFSLDIKAEGTLIEVRSGVVSQHQNLIFRLIKIEDSRCAIGVTCIWAGQLLVTLEVSDNQTESLEIKLVRKRKAETVFTFGYGFRLLNVEPHPQKDKTIQFSEQIVQIEIVKIAK
jgi:hypothetical protein